MRTADIFFNLGVILSVYAILGLAMFGGYHLLASAPTKHVVEYKGKTLICTVVRRKVNSDLHCTNGKSYMDVMEFEVVGEYKEPNN